MLADVYIVSEVLRVVPRYKVLWYVTSSYNMCMNMIKKTSIHNELDCQSHKILFHFDDIIISTCVSLLRIQKSILNYSVWDGLTYHMNQPQIYRKNSQNRSEECPYELKLQPASKQSSKRNKTTVNSMIGVFQTIW